MDEIQQLIEQALIAEQDKRKDRVRSGKYNPSYLGRCYRLQYWNRKDEPVSNPPELEGLLRMAQGVHTHKMIQGYLPPEICEVKVETDDLLGYADIELIDNITDIKCTSAYSFKRFRNIPTDIYIKNNSSKFLQPVYYSTTKGKTYATLRENVFGTFEHVNHTVNVNDLYEGKTWKQWLEEEIQILKGFWTKQTLPPPEPRAFGGNDCAYCSFRTRCEEKEEKDG